MKVLITGCQGMLGADLMEVFRPGHEILGLDRPEIDITDLEQCLSIAEEFRPEVILNAARRFKYFVRISDTLPSGKASAPIGCGFEVCPP